MPKTKTRSIRVADDVWAAFLAVCLERGENGSAVLNRYIRKYAASKKP